MAERSSEEFSEQPLPSPSPGSEHPDRDPEDAPNSQRHTSVARILELQDRGHKGANWFYWIAGLSLVNSVIVHGGGTISFVVGLGITLVVDAVAKAVGEQHPEMDVVLKAVAIGFTCAVAIVVAGFGWLARRGMLIVFAIGMFLYLLDGLLFLVFQDFMSVAFHGFALYSMWSGLSAFREINAIKDDLGAEPD
jgi:hypothetical protein